ncbi:MULTISPECIES: RNA polymerase factor sigma-32 [Thalassotalea]|uniref:RNA polymerase factor sigma-32 n=1 Tax=Thalassotalea castellviae TaxID=3075612 RepID=A0ABU3A3G7_9GAMM|nr:RNA polymerase factor sigma-32 [Thalassotalea sp. W431]MDT0604721.1 RNA polymerase factor sigma-32 [Thalassotalea sp. W431]
MSIHLPISLQSSGSFDAYLNYVNSLPLLNEQQEKDLFLEYQENSDLQAAQKIVLSHLRFVAHIARSYKGYGLPLEDLVQEGTIGLMKSVKKFNLDFGVRLSSFAIHYIKAEIQEYVIRNWRLVKATTTKAKRKLFFNLRRLKAKTQWLTHQDKQQIAHKLDVDEADIDDMESHFSQSDIYVNSLAAHDDEAAVNSTEAFFEDKSEHFTSRLSQKEFNDKAIGKIKEIIKNLDERTQDIIVNRWLGIEKLPHKHFAEKYGVSQERIRQIEEKALALIKQKISLFDA